MTAPPRRPELAALVMIAALLVLPACGTERTAASAPPAAQSTDAVDALSSYRSTRTYAPVAAPTRLRIPAIEVDTELQLLDRAPDQTIEVPVDPRRRGGPAVRGRGRPARLCSSGTSTREPAPRCSTACVSSRPATRCSSIVPTVRRPGSLRRRSIVREGTVPERPHLLSDARAAAAPRDVRRTVRSSTGHYRDNVVVFADAAA